MKQLREENIKLKRPVADLSLDKAMLQVADRSIKVAQPNTRRLYR